MTSAVLVGFAITTSCGNAGSKFGGDGGDASAQDGSISFGDGFGFGDTGGKQDSGDCTKCSGDLHSVLDCNDNVITTCPSDQGCGAGGVCVPACQAATDNKSTVGCDYYAADVATDTEADGACFAAYIANTWTSDVTLTVQYKTQTLNVANFARIPTGSGSSLTYSTLPGGKLPAGKVAILFLADWKTGGPGHVDYTACPAGITAAVTTDEVSSENTGILDAFHITSSAPIVGYDIFPYGGSTTYISSATLLVPTSAWDVNYLTIDGYAPPSWATASSPQQPYVQVVAMQNGTQVTISPTAAIVGGNGVSATAKGVPITYNLNAGQILQLKQYDEINGSPIESNYPIGVWGGHSCMEVDVADTACDSAHQQLFPIKAMGNQYVAVKHKDRSAFPEAPPWRIMGAVDGTTLTYVPSKPSGAPSTLSSGQLVKFSAAGPFTVTSQDAQHPFYLGAHMTGEDSQGSSMGTGDPEWVNVIPPAQWLPRYLFMTDPTMSFTNIVLVRDQIGGSYKDVTLDCLGTVSAWQSVSGTTFQYARIDIASNGAAVGACNNGLHEIHSDGVFGLTVWGWDQYVSYAYPGGASVQPINNVVVLPVPK